MNYNDFMVKLVYHKKRVSYENETILRDIAWMLTFLKNHKKLGLLSATDRRELDILINDILGIKISPRTLPLDVWQYHAYFRLKNIILDLIETGRYHKTKEELLRS